MKRSRWCVGLLAIGLAVSACKNRSGSVASSKAASAVSAAGLSDRPRTKEEEELYRRLILSQTPRPPVTDGEMLVALHSTNRDIVRESLAGLTAHGAAGEYDRADELLSDSDPFTWLNAAHYLGSNGRSESIPWLIKTLNLQGAALTARPRAVGYLQKMTGQKIGDDFKSWSEWYDASHPGETFDWNSNRGHWGG